jgi:hypothetical protein
MSPEKQRIAIAEACAWQHRLATNENPVERGGMRLPNRFSIDGVEAWWHDGRPENTGVYAEPPRYLSDLNAMHEAEKTLLSEYEAGRSSDWLEYDRQLKVITDAGVGRGHYRTSKLWHATAAQRAEAFLRTIGKWEHAA